MKPASMCRLIVFALTIFWVPLSAHGDRFEFQGTSGNWEFFGEVFDGGSGDGNGGRTCEMTTQMADGTQFGILWADFDSGARAVALVHDDPSDEAATLLQFEPSGYLPVLDYWHSKGGFHFYIIAGAGEREADTASSAQRFYDLFARSTTVNTPRWKWPLSGSKEALSSDAFNQCVGGIFTPTSLRAFGLPHLIPRDLPTSPSSVPLNALFTNRGSKLFFEGEIVEGFARELLLQVIAHSPSHLVILASPGGLVDEAIEAAETLQRMQIGTQVIGDCASACVTLFAGGEERIAGAGSRFGIHQNWTDSGMIEIDAHQDLILRATELYRASGIDTQLIFEAMRTPSDDIRWLTVEEAVRFGLVSGVDTPTLTPSNPRENHLGRTGQASR